jgi:hypothetical protein
MSSSEVPIVSDRSEQSQPLMRTKTVVGISKDAFALAKEVAIVVVLALLFVWPERINFALDKAGVVSADFAGIKWAVQKRTGEAQQQVQFVKQDLQDTITKLNAIAARLDDQPTKEALGNITRDLASSVKSTDVALSDLQASRAAQEAIAGPPRADPEARGLGAVVISADATLPEAEHEAKKAQAAPNNYTSVQFYERDPWIRTVVEFPTTAAAQSEVEKLRSTFPGAYAVTLAEWCPNRTLKEGTTMYVCR